MLISCCLSPFCLYQVSNENTLSGELGLSLYSKTRITNKLVKMGFVCVVFVDARTKWSERFLFLQVSDVDFACAWL